MANELIIEIKTVANCDLNCYYSSTLNRVRAYTIPSGVLIVNKVFSDLIEARIFMLDEACRLMDEGHEVTIIPYVN